MYAIDIEGNRKAALIMKASTPGSHSFNASASAGRVDQTSDDMVGESGRKAIGPVGRKRWYAVAFGGWSEERGA